MGRKVLGVVGVVWGTAIIFGLTREGIDLGTLYGTGEFAGLLVGVVFVVAGLTSLMRPKPRA